MRLKALILTTIFCAAGFGSLVYAEIYVHGAEVILQSGVIDLRGIPHLRKAGDNKPSGFYSAQELRVGSIFITEDNIARKVSAVYEDRGRTVIETVEPNIEEVIVGAYIPDQEIKLSAANIDPQSIHPGVQVLDTAATAAMVSAAGVHAQAEMPNNSKWLETDPDWMGKDVIAINIDIPLFSGGDGITDKIKEWVSDAESPQEPDGGSQDGGDGSADKTKSELDVGVSGEVRIQGILRLAEPVVKTGMKSPVMKVTWVKVWWYVYYPKVEFENGYIHASFAAAQQCDFKLTASVTLSAELKIPLYTLIIPIAEVGTIMVGVYFKVTLEGTITLGFEVSEYTSVELWGTVDLAWPFIPYDVRLGGDYYANFAVRPSLAAEIENKNGLYLGFEGKLFGLKLLSAEVGGGIYQTAEGYLESRGIIGYSTDYGSYGGFDGWNYNINYELGGYVDATLGFAFIEVDLFDFRWPFLELEWAGEF